MGSALSKKNKENLPTKNGPNRRVHAPKGGLYQLYIKLGSELLATSLPITLGAPNKQEGWNKRARGEILGT